MGCKISVDLRETLKGSPGKNSAIVKKKMKSIHTSPMINRKLSTKISSVSPDYEDDKIDEGRSSRSTSPEVIYLETPDSTDRNKKPYKDEYKVGLDYF
jgi:hypothetical protein